MTTRLHLAGLSPVDIANIIGHEKATEAERTYLHIPLDHLRANLERMELPAWMDELPTWREMSFDERLPAPRELGSA